MVDQAHVHHGPKMAGSYLGAGRSELRHNPVYQRSGNLRGGRLGERGPPAPGRVGIERELADKSTGKPSSSAERFMLPVPSGNRRSCRIFAASRSAAFSSSSRPTPTSVHKPRPILPTTTPSTLTDASETRLDQPTHCAEA